MMSSAAQRAAVGREEMQARRIERERERSADAEDLHPLVGKGQLDDLLNRGRIIGQ